MTATLAVDGDEIDLVFSNLTIGLPSFGPVESNGLRWHWRRPEDQRIQRQATGTTVGNYLFGVKSTFNFFSLPTTSAYLAGYAALQTHNVETSSTSKTNIETAFGGGVGASFSFGVGKVYGEIGAL